MKNIMCQIFLISFFLGAFVQSQSILIKSYDQGDSTTQCTDGLLNDIDTVVFKSFVDITHARSVKIIYFVIKRSMDSDFKSFKTFDVIKDCHSESVDCKLIGKSTFVITLRLRAHLILSKAKLRGVIVTLNSEEIFSDVIEFPHIYGIKDTTESLIINGRHVDISNTKCMEHIHNGEFNLEFRCTSLASPCVIRMALNTSNIIERETNVLRYRNNFEESTAFKVSINYAACRLDAYFKTVNCEIRIDPRPMQNLDQYFDDKLTAIIVLAIISAFALICSFFCIWKRAWRSLKSDLKTFFRRLFNKINLSTDDSNVYVFKDEHQNEDILRENLKKLNTSNNETSVCKSLLEFDHTREPFFDESVMNMIYLIGKLTVMITVETITGLNRQGTGLIGFATKYGNDEKKTTCSCHKCISSTPEGKIEGEIVVYTSTNIVATNEDAKNATCVLFFDDSNSETITLNGKVLNGIKGQKCKFTCFTCDTKTLDEIIKFRNSLNQKNPDFNHTYKRLGKSSSENRTIIISHPFGMHKHISIGKWIKRETMKFMESFTLTNYRYTAPTFQGSAGAHVYLLGRDHGGFIYVHHHIGVDGNGYGYCGFGMDLN